MRETDCECLAGNLQIERFYSIRIGLFVDAPLLTRTTCSFDVIYSSYISLEENLSDRFNDLLDKYDAPLLPEK